VVGGVGITPVSSFLAALDESKAGSRAFLLWLVREPSLLDVFPSAVRRPSSRVWITCAPPEQENVDVNVQFGRPDLCAAIAGVVAPPALVFACGPIALVREASAIARDLGHHFYAEEFSF
jgi:ferredoxin-NADP reductase